MVKEYTIKLNIDDKKSMSVVRAKGICELGAAQDEEMLDKHILKNILNEMIDKGIIYSPKLRLNHKKEHRK